MIINPEDHSPRYFYVIYPIKCKPNAFYSSNRMSQLPQLMIPGCYDELLADLSLLQSFSEDKWMSVHELPHLGALCFCIVEGGLFFWLVSLELWSQARVEFITSSGRKTRSEEIIPMAILLTNRVGEGSLAMVTVFCRSDQAKGEPSVTPLTLFQLDSPELSIVVVKIFTNSLYVP